MNQKMMEFNHSSTVLITIAVNMIVCSESTKYANWSEFDQMKIM